jgi:ketosteroid isomerase-like protein
MSQENVEIIRRGTDAYNRRAFQEAVLYMDPEIEWDMSRVQVPEPGVYRGFDGLLTFLSSWDEGWEAHVIDPEEFIDAGDQVVLISRQLGRGKMSGIDVEQQLAQVWTLRDKKIVRMTAYPSKADALEAVGLSEQDAHADS